MEKKPKTCIRFFSRNPHKIFFYLKMCLRISPELGKQEKRKMHAITHRTLVSSKSGCLNAYKSQARLFEFTIHPKLAVLPLGHVCHWKIIIELIIVSTYVTFQVWALCWCVCVGVWSFIFQILQHSDSFGKGSWMVFRCGIKNKIKIN